jgi:hypothetical protein
LGNNKHIAVGLAGTEAALLAAPLFSASAGAARALYLP